MWSQVYDPFGNMFVSAAVAAIPVFVLLGSIALFEIKAHYAAILGLLAIPGALVGVVVVNHIPEHGARIGFVALTLFTAYKIAASAITELREERS